MSNKPVSLESLSRAGRALLSERNSHTAHQSFMRWADQVAEWLDDQFPGSGYSADWSGLPVSMLLVNNCYDMSSSAREKFNRTVGQRLQWLGAFGRESSRRAVTVDSDTQESDAMFAQIANLVTTSLIPQQFKNAVGDDLVEAQKSYRSMAYKACVVMLGASLEGLMLGTLQRSDVITHLATATSVPKLIKALGTRDPALPESLSKKPNSVVCRYEQDALPN